MQRVRRTADIIRLGAPIPADCPLVVQVSRWDPLKDPIGVMEAFARLDLDRHNCHLALVGPDVSGVTCDPDVKPYPEGRSRIV